MGTKGAPDRPAKISDRYVYQDIGERETVDFAARRNKRRRARDLAKAQRKKNRK